MSKIISFKTITVVGFDTKREPGKLIVFFTRPESEVTRRAYAHPAMAFRRDDEPLSPIARMAQEKLTASAEIIETEEGWKFFNCFKPTKARVEDYEAYVKAMQDNAPKTREATAEDIASVDF